MGWTRKVVAAVGVAAAAICLKESAAVIIDGELEAREVDTRFGTKKDEWFGWSVAATGTTVAAASVDPYSSRGSVFIYEQTESLGKFNLIKKVDGPVGVFRFGVSISASGDNLLIGADIGNGKAFLLNKNNGNWDTMFEVRGDATNGGFGSATALMGSTAVVSAGSEGAVYVFVESTESPGVWERVAKMSEERKFEYFGFVVATGGDIVVVGALNADGQRGAVYVYRRNKGGPNAFGLEQRLVAKDRKPGNWFGGSLAVSEDGEVIVIGSNGSKGGKGAVYIFERDGRGRWRQRKRLVADNGSSNDYFGVSVAYSRGRVLVASWDAGDADKGAAYVFEKNTRGDWVQGVTLAAPYVNNEAFGTWVALSGDTAVVGDYLAENDDGVAAGSVHFYQIGEFAEQDPRHSGRAVVAVEATKEMSAADIAQAVLVTNALFSTLDLGPTASQAAFLAFGAESFSEIVAPSLLTASASPSPSPSVVTSAADLQAAVTAFGESIDVKALPKNGVASFETLLATYGGGVLAALDPADHPTLIIISHGHATNQERAAACKARADLRAAAEHVQVICYSPAPRRKTPSDLQRCMCDAVWLASDKRREDTDIELGLQLRNWIEPLVTKKPNPCAPERSKSNCRKVQANHNGDNVRKLSRPMCYWGGKTCILLDRYSPLFE